jgi:hypothetical protein
VRAADGTAVPLVEPALGADSALGPSPCGDRDRDLASAWARDASAECASITAFLQLALDLLANGAPDDLVAAALDAAEDEARHAHACAAMAGRWLRRPFRPQLPPIPLRAPHAGDHDAIARLAIESWLDGALGEGAAAARALAAARQATDDRSRSIQRRIAADEARHAALGWRVLGWALALGDPSVAERVRARRDVEPFAPDEPSTTVTAARHGRLPADRAHSVTTRSAMASRAALDRALSA